MGRKILLGILFICFVLLIPLPASAVSPGPTISILSPVEGAAVSKPSLLVLVQVWDADGLVEPNNFPLSEVKCKIDGAAYIQNCVTPTSRNCGTNCRIYEYLWDLTPYADDSVHKIRFLAYNDARLGQATRTPGLSITVRAAKTGDGMLMVRDSSSQLCMDCHNIEGHSSQTSHASPTTPSVYGKWETICLDCHTAHNTTNIDLIRGTVNNYTYISTTAIKESVRFYNRTGNAPYSYVNSSAVGTNITGICQVCHTQTKNPTTLALRWVDVGNPENGHYQNPTENCSNCHLHTEGFRGRNCEQCHLSPPETGRHDVHGESARYVYGSLVIDSTTDAYGYDCGICHDGTHQTPPTGPDYNPHTAEVIFAGVAIQDPVSGLTATYVPSTYSIYTGFNGYEFNYSDGTCSNTYCHGNYPGAGIDKNIPISYERTSSIDCGMECHNAKNDAPSIPVTGSHERHVSSTAKLSGETVDWHTYNRGYSCTLCHGDLSGVGSPSSTGSFSNYIVTDKTRHVNGVVDWQFDTADPRTKDGFYSIATGSAVPSDGVTPRDYGYCTVYCHSNVQGYLGYGPPSVYSTLTWTTERNRCANCHVPDGSTKFLMPDMSTVPASSGTGTTEHGRTIATGSHTRHYNDMNRNGCDDATPCMICHIRDNTKSIDFFDNCTDANCNVACHDTLSGSTKERDTHVNGIIDVTIATYYGGTYYKGVSVAPGSGYGEGSDSYCSNTYCHSDGTSIKTGTLIPNNSLAWGTEQYRQCYDCHSNTYYGTSDYRKAGPINISGIPPNAHQLHMRQSGSSVEDPSCAHCHYETTTDNTSIASLTTHMNKFYNVSLNAGTLEYPSWAGNETGASKPVTIGSFTFAYGSSAVSTCTNVSCHPDGLGTNTAMWSETYYCTECHKVDMSNTAGYHHVMNFSALTSRVYPIIYPTSSAADTNRKCIMCHVDHTTFNPMLNAISNARANNLRTSIFSPPTTYENYTNTDFIATHTYGGICTSCHMAEMTKNTSNQKGSDNTTTTPVITRNMYKLKSHDYEVTSTFTSTQSGNFYANCSKCHNTGNDTKTFQNTTNKFATHDNTQRRLVSVLGMSTTDETQEESMCFRCHSNTADTIGGTKKSADANDWYGAVTNMSAASRNVYAVMSSYSVTTSNTLYFKNTSVENPVEPRASANLLNSGTYTDNTYKVRSMSPGSGTSPEIKMVSTTSGPEQRYFRVAQFVSPPIHSTVTYNSGLSFWLRVYDWEATGDEDCELSYALYQWKADDAEGTNFRTLSTGPEFSTSAGTQNINFTSSSAVTFNPGDKIMVELEILADSPTASNLCTVTWGGSGDNTRLQLPSALGFRIPSGYRHNVAYYNGLHKPSLTDETQAYISSNKHVECDDCHNVHATDDTKHSAGTNNVSSVLSSVPGVTATFSGSNWTAPTSYSLQTLATKEYQICFKCHSGSNTNYASWGGSGAASWSDAGLEFSTGNKSGHPVAVGLSSYPNSTPPKALPANKLIAPWNTNLGTQTMYCSDCHSTDSTVSSGPHASSVKWMLAGINKAWPYQGSANNGTSTGTYWTPGNSATSAGTSNGLFCLNCHQNLTGGSANSEHQANGSVACASCHIRVPHGGKVSRLINTNTGGRVWRYAPDGSNGGTINYNSYNGETW